MLEVHLLEKNHFLFWGCVYPDTFEVELQVLKILLNVFELRRYHYLSYLQFLPKIQLSQLKLPIMPDMLRVRRIMYIIGC